MPQPAVQVFVKDQYDENKVFLVTTSDSEDSQMDGIDGISGASAFSRINQDKEILFYWLDGVYTKLN